MRVNSLRFPDCIKYPEADFCGYQSGYRYGRIKEAQIPYSLESVEPKLLQYKWRIISRGGFLYPIEKAGFLH